MHRIRKTGRNVRVTVKKEKKNELKETCMATKRIKT